MTVLLVLCALIAFLTADYFVQRSRRAPDAVPRFSPADIELPDGIALAGNHTWTRMDGAGEIVIGIDRFLGSMVGAAEKVLLPEEGAMLSTNVPAVTIAAGTRALRLAAPLEGQVIAVNRELLDNPAAACRDPYSSGWLLKVAPPQDRRAVPAMLRGDAARQWLAHQFRQAREFFAGLSASGTLATAPDGGVLMDGTLMHYESEVWTEFERRFASLPGQEEPAPSSRLQN